MASTEQEAAVEAAAVVEEVTRQQGKGCGVAGGGDTVGSWRNIDIAWRKADEAAIRRYEAANWLRRIVGVVCAKDLAEEPSEEEFRIGLRNGIILCNALNKIQPGAVPKVVEVPSDSTAPVDGTALCAYQYFENVRNFLTGMQDLGLTTFEASDLEKGGQGVRVVDCVLAMKSFCDAKHVGKRSPFKYGGIVKPLSGKYVIRKNNEPYMKVMMRSHSAELLRDGISLEQIGLDFSLEPTETTATPDSIRMLVQTVLADKKPEEIPSVVESLLSKVINEYDCRIASQSEVVKDTMEQVKDTMEQVKDTMDTNDCNSVLRMDSPFDTNDTKSLSRVDSPQVESTTPSDLDKATENIKMDEDEQNASSLTEDVSTLVPLPVPVPLSNDIVINIPKIVRNFDQEEKQIQDLKSNMSTVKSFMEQLKLLYSEDLKKLGDHLRIISHAASGYRKVVEENRKLYNQIQDLRGNIRVYCRVRPFHPGKEFPSSSVAGIEDRTITVMVPSKHGKDGKKSFTFNSVFGPLATQADVFTDMQPLVRSVLDGFNVCIFAYGQTGSGKTFTMSGPKILTEEGLGVNYRALNDLFGIQEQRKDTICYEIAVQMMEIYNEQVRDLLQTGGNKTLEIRNNSQNGIAVPDANVVPVRSTADVIDLMNLGQKNRTVCSTAMNDRSSRSHSCLTVHVQGRDLTSGTVLRGCMHLVDLAGSERVDKSEVVGIGLKEAQHINKSLAALGDVIAALAQKSTHVPYRNSKLTQLLQDSLGGQAKTLMFIHIAPEPDAISESISTLKFAERVSTIELGAAKSSKEGGGGGGGEARELKEQIACLRAALARKDGDHESIRSTQSSPDIYRMGTGNASPASRHPIEDGIIENDSALGDLAEHSQFGSSNSLPELGPDATQDLAFYQRSNSEQQWSWSGSVATEDSDDFEVATNCSLELDCVRPSSAPKASGLSNGGGTAVKKIQVKGSKGSDVRGVNPGKRSSPLQKKPSGPSPTLIKKGGGEGRKTPNGKTGTKK
ncbi:P-loop nucleoside triphosphate hydrolase superfamily protein with CH (Calponin Homology) domain [Zea mays]|uniref:p-loop nucleoside triphosphate hydrolase superfamily protein with CH (Calponin Homology) domain n=6 Tax=Zea mays TaxID=4577 RepID=A0A1D6F894_MAIZE|nr:P-loop nucleoside triphosphate hydrolase superfamily protein with CH (Calponin Homology) domain [Zea mays]ONM27399.1 P-loop nucleoside triphosphate hydrolase superfamily protein with CH (Calponin Homology) domain [Zea mays]ONM27416.1 P-loop nucleoside triphosphate hydrolase superfamily protein with CH (Calponin Homology) domain [Zea mays]ONM27419.1 P-loop nucleoside triphosphate hydrolase superfamily protein with CH (Calponin Homology) domain [Zea mays]